MKCRLRNYAKLSSCRITNRLATTTLLLASAVWLRVFILPSLAASLVIIIILLAILHVARALSRPSSLLVVLNIAFFLRSAFCAS
jgi:hypothetical protein